MILVYVKLLGEGTRVYRPAQAEFIDNVTARLQPVIDYASLGEDWEFPPGSVVKCVTRQMDGEAVFVAISKST
jgi:hypothetical protein